eukprot:403372177
MAQPTDVKHILDISAQERDGQSRKLDKKLKDKKKRPEKVNREVFALIGDVPQLAPALGETTKDIVKKEKNNKKRVDPWTWHKFTNPARSDSFKLSHWIKKEEEEEVYPFARFNRKVEVIHYNDEEYQKAVDEADINQSAMITGQYAQSAYSSNSGLKNGTASNTDWNKLETDHLFRLCEKYSLRFIIIADRFEEDVDEDEEQKLIEQYSMNGINGKKRELKAKEKQDQKMNKALIGSGSDKAQETKPSVRFHERTVDEIKDRYYAVAKAILEYRGDVENQIVKKPFNFEQEIKRKCNLEKLFLRTKEQHEKEKLLIAELKKLEQKIKKEEKEEKNLRRLIYNDSSFSLPPVNNGNQGVPEYVGQAANGEDDLGQKGGRRDRGSGVYLRSQVLQATLPTKKEHLQKKFEIVMKELKIDPLELKPTQRVVDKYQELMNEILKMFALQNYIKKKKEDLGIINEVVKEKKAFLQLPQLQLQSLRQQDQEKQQLASRNPVYQQSMGMPGGPGGQPPMSRGPSMQGQMPPGPGNAPQYPPNAVMQPSQQQIPGSVQNTMNASMQPMNRLQMQQQNPGQGQLPPGGIPPNMKMPMNMQGGQPQLQPLMNQQVPLMNQGIPVAGQQLTQQTVPPQQQQLPPQGIPPQQQPGAGIQPPRDRRHASQIGAQQQTIPSGQNIPVQLPSSTDELSGIQINPSDLIGAPPLANKKSPNKGGLQQQSSSAQMLDESHDSSVHDEANQQSSTKKPKKSRAGAANQQSGTLSVAGSSVGGVVAGGSIGGQTSGSKKPSQSKKALQQQAVSQGSGNINQIVPSGNIVVQGGAAGAGAVQNQANLSQPSAGGDNDSASNSAVRSSARQSGGTKKRRQ